jgi:hypothetical protein
MTTMAINDPTLITTCLGRPQKLDVLIIKTLHYSLVYTIHFNKIIELFHHSKREGTMHPYMAQACPQLKDMAQSCPPNILSRLL